MEINILILNLILTTYNNKEDYDFFAIVGIGSSPPPANYLSFLSTSLFSACTAISDSSWEGAGVNCQFERQQKKVDFL